MTLFHALILGLLQGLTEFLPISSSGHIRIVGQILPNNDVRVFGTYARVIVCLNIRAAMFGDDFASSTKTVHGGGHDAPSVARAFADGIYAG